MKLIKRYNSEYAEYLKDESRQTGKAEYIAFASSEADVTQVMEFCRENNLPITIQGSRTGITAGSVPDGGLILNLQNMNKITGIGKDDAGKWYLSCQPGLKLQELREVLKEREYDTSGWTEEAKKLWKEFIRCPRHFFPPDPTETSASLGGMASCNASGARSLKYGAVRNWIRSIKTICFNTAAAADEYLLQGSRLLPEVKNAAGYFLQQPRRDFDHFIGAEGTLGVIVELEIMIIPEPRCCWAMLQFFPSEQQALLFSEKLVSAEHMPDAVEYFGNNALNILRQNKLLWQELPEMISEWKFAVYYEFSGQEQSIVEDAIYAAGELAEEYGSAESDCWFVDTPQGIRNLKIFRHALPEAINLMLDRLKQQDSRLAKISTDLAVPRGHLKEMVELYRQAEAAGWQVVVFGHIGNNHLHTNIIPHNFDEYQQGKKLAKQWAQQAVELGGTVSAEHGIGKVKRNLLQIMYSAEDLQMFMQLKKQYDPLLLLNKGNLIDI